VEVLTSVDRERIAALRARNEFFWLDVVEPSAQQLATLIEELMLHPMAAEDTREFGQRPKLDRYRDHALLVFYSAREAPDESERAFTPVEVHAYVSGDYVATIRREACPPLDDLHAQLGTGEHTELRVLYRILDALTDAHYPVLAKLDARIDDLEEAVLERPRDAQLAGIYRLKQDVHDLQRRISAQRDGFPAAADAILEIPGLEREQHLYLRDIGDHLTQISGELFRLGADLAGLTDTYFNANANRLNAIAARLTLVATVFVIATLFTGFFGQNFGWLVGHVNSFGDFLVFGVIVPVAAMGGFLAVALARRGEWL